MYFFSTKSLLNKLWTIIDVEILEADNRKTILEEDQPQIIAITVIFPTIQVIKILIGMVLYLIPLVLKKWYLKYQQLAKDAQSSGDPVLIENYLQHAEHFSRKLAEINLKSKTTEDTTIKSDDVNLNSDNSSEKKI